MNNTVLISLAALAATILSGTAFAQSTCGPVSTTKGAVEGSPAGSACVFKGIPYARPPVGDLRWRPPQEHDQWADVLNTTAFSNICSQFSAGKVIGNEDCLYLNVWAPSSLAHASLPVLVYFHGGGHVQGSGAGIAYTYDGQDFVERAGVMVVTVNYRLNVLGLLALPSLDAESDRQVSGNYSLQDQSAALRWVQNNIAAFGGDPQRVMIFGQSSGAYDVSLHLISPLSKGLFSMALMESIGSDARAILPLAQYEQLTGAQVVKAAGCDTSPDIPTCLRALPAETIVAAVPGLSSLLEPDVFVENIDGYVVPDSVVNLVGAGLYSPVPVIIGNTADESYNGFTLGSIPDEATYRTKIYAFFGQTGGDLVLSQYPASAYPTPERAFITVATDNTFVCQSRTLARALTAAQAQPVYRYLFTHQFGSAAPQSRRFAYHTEDLFFVWRNFGPVQSATYMPSDAEWGFSDEIEGYWSRFATTGNPNGGGSAFWPMYSVALDPFLKLDVSITADAGLRSANCDFWDAHPELDIWLLKSQ
jgi:para-nitrobenzyl esterase